MAWLAQRGIARDYWQYLELPIAVLSDCRLVMAAQSEMEQPDTKPTQDLIAQDQG